MPCCDREQRPFPEYPFDELSKLYHDGFAGEVLLIENRSSRIVHAGILPTLETVLRRELTERGVPEKALTVQAGEYGTGWKMARALRDWLEEHPQAQVTVLWDQFGSRAEPILSGRCWARTPPDGSTGGRFPTSATTSRTGGTADTGSWHCLDRMCRCCTLCGWRASEPAERWDPDKFEQNLSGP